MHVTTYYLLHVVPGYIRDDARLMNIMICQIASRMQPSLNWQNNLSSDLDARPNILSQVACDLHVWYTSNSTMIMRKR